MIEILVGCEDAFPVIGPANAKFKKSEKTKNNIKIYLPLMSKYRIKDI
jgi:hypothetical protein